jgi:hypothetical protein
MRVVSFALFTLLVALPLLPKPASAPAASNPSAQAMFASDRIQLSLNTDEAEAVLAIPDKRAAGTPVTEND